MCLLSFILFNGETLCIYLKPHQVLEPSFSWTRGPASLVKPCILYPSPYKSVSLTVDQLPFHPHPSAPSTIHLLIQRPHQVFVHPLAIPPPASRKHCCDLVGLCQVRAYEAAWMHLVERRHVNLYTMEIQDVVKEGLLGRGRRERVLPGAEGQAGARQEVSTACPE